MSGKYRELRVQATASAALDPVVASLNQHFRPDDFHLVRNGSCLDLWLREVSLEDLEEVVAQLSARYPEAVATLQAVPAAVHSVRSYGLNGRKRLYVGYNAERKTIDRKAKEQRRGKHYYANDHAFGKERNALPECFGDSVICGDSEEVLKKLPDNCIDLIFTSPPYNFGLDYQSNGDAADWESYFEKLFRVFDECIRVLTFGGRIVVNVQPLFSDYIPGHHIISNHFMNRRLIWKGEILWQKNNYNCKYTAWGSWKSPASPYLKYTWEFLEVFCKGDLKKPGASQNADIDAESFKKWVVANWSIAPERKMKQYGHPAMFPEELARRVMLLFSFRGDVVLDPFAGTGTTCAVACQHQRQFVGIDIVPEYCEAARQRVRDIQPSLDLS